MRTLILPGPSRSRCGGALVATLIIVAVLAAMAATALTVNPSSKQVIDASRSRMRAIYLAEAGVAEALGTLYASGLNGQAPAGSYGDRSTPRTSDAGEFWTQLLENSDGTYTAMSTAAVDGAERSLEVIVELKQETIYDHALFAGNIAGDSSYEMALGGRGVEADRITGDVYSGGSILMDGDARVSGALRSSGPSSEPGAREHVVLASPDITAMNYPVHHDVHVAAEFASPDAAWMPDDAGGSAWQLPRENPAHIFRKNPSDRSSADGDNGRDNFFLEDPYEPVLRDRDHDGTDAYPITLTGTAGTPGTDTSRAVFFIDGNLWVHNKPTFSFKFVHADGESVNCTFVVRGNIYLSDNLFYEDTDTDGIAFIAMRDEGVDDTGNIYFGNPVGGTVEHMDAFLYAENDLIDVNLSSDGSKAATLYGNMAAGNQIVIDRSHQGRHSKLTVVFDERIKTGDMHLPGLPTGSTGGPKGSAYAVVSWREVDAHRWVNGGRDSASTTIPYRSARDGGGAASSTSMDSGELSPEELPPGEGWGTEEETPDGGEQ
ncbi:MAG: hypothetical protein ACI8QZ_002684 [Chlamydiales bacterium]